MIKRTRNMAQCLECGSVLESIDGERVECGCPNHVSVDLSSQGQRVTAKNLDRVLIVDDRDAAVLEALLKLWDAARTENFSIFGHCETFISFEDWPDEWGSGRFNVYTSSKGASAIHEDEWNYKRAVGSYIK